MFLYVILGLIITTAVIIYGSLPKCRNCNKRHFSKDLEGGICYDCLERTLVDKHRIEQEKQKRIEREQEELMQKCIELEKERQEKLQKKQEAEQRRLNYEEKRKKAIEEKIKSFEEALNSVPRCEIYTDDNYLPEDFETENYTFSSLRKNHNTEKAGNFTVIDVGTTGLNPAKDRIVEVCAIKFRYYEPIEVFQTLVNPQKKMSKTATQINHITDEMVIDAPIFNQIIPALSKFISNDNLVGHNLEFDLRFLEYGGYNVNEKKRKYYDTLQIARSIIHRDDIDNYKLNTCCEYFDIYRNEAHRSASDSYATALLFIKLIQEKTEIYNIKDMFCK